MTKEKTLVNESQVWFDKMISNLNYDQFLFDTKILPKDRKVMYDAMINMNHDVTNQFAREHSSMYFIQKMVKSYFEELVNSNGNKPSKMAMELSNSKILVWAEIKEDDERMENALILSEAKINAQFSEYGFHISSTIVDDTDKLKVPEHYINVDLAN